MFNIYLKTFFVYKVMKSESCKRCTIYLESVLIMFVSTRNWPFGHLSLSCNGLVL